MQLAAGRIRSFITLDSGILDYTRMLTTRFKSAQIACRYSNLGSQVLNRRCNYTVHCVEDELGCRRCDGHVQGDAPRGLTSCTKYQIGKKVIFKNYGSMYLKTCIIFSDCLMMICVHQTWHVA